MPTIAAVNGPAYGAGNDLACMCDIRIASDKAVFAESFAKLGLLPGDGGAWLLPRAVGMSRACEMSFTGEAIDAQQALAWGLVSRVVPADELMPAACRWRANRRQPGAPLRMTKAAAARRPVNQPRHAAEMSAGFQALAHHTEEHEAALDGFLKR